MELYSLRRQIGVVPQDSLLFDGTIKDNLLMVKPDATSEELIRAARIACAHDFIGSPPGLQLLRWRTRCRAIGRTTAADGPGQS